MYPNVLICFGMKHETAWVSHLTLQKENGMSNTTIEQDLTKALKRAKRIVAERAGELHDLVEERLPEDYEQLPILSQACYEACLEWATLKEQIRKLAD